MCYVYLTNYSWPLNNTGVRATDHLSSRKPLYNFIFGPSYLLFCIYSFNQPQNMWYCM